MVKRIVKTLITTLFSTLILALTLLPAAAQTPAHTLTQQLATYLDSYQGVIYAVIENDQKIVGGMGYADKENTILADPANTAFHIGSISKTFVAIAVLQQVEAGRLNLDQDIHSYLEDDGFNFQYPVTLHQLLTHTAGFEDLISGIAVNDPKNMLSLKESLLQYQPSQFIEPATLISYSNYGLALAAYIVEKVSDTPFDAYAQANIFEPLAMNHTTFDQNQTNIFVSKAYASDKSLAKEPLLNLYPEGSVITTANDMINYMSWCLSDEPILLSTASKELLFTSQYSGSEDFEGISYTFNIHNYNDNLIVEKKGETAFFNSQLVLYPSHNAALFMSFNTPLPWTNITSIQNTITKEILGYRQTVEKPKITSIDPTGVYQASRSNFTTVERFLGLLIPDRSLSITRSGTNEYKLNGRPMMVIGENLYESIIGEVKITRVRGEVVILTDSALSYIEVSNIRDPLWQWVAIISFIALTAFSFIKQIFNWLKGRKNFYALMSSTFTLVFLIAFVLTLFNGLSEYNLLQVQTTLTWTSILSILAAFTTLILQMKRLRFHDHRFQIIASLLIVNGFAAVMILNNVIPSL